MAETNESLYIALGLKPDADFESAVIMASDKSEAVRKIMTITKSENLADALGIVQANALAAERYEAAERKLALIEKEQAEKEFDLAAKAGDLVGKFTPAMAKSEWAQEMRAKGMEGVRELKSFLQHAPVIVSRKAPVADEDSVDIELTDKEIEVAKRFAGDDPVVLKKRLEMLKASKLEDRRARKAARQGG